MDIDILKNPMLISMRDNTDVAKVDFVKTAISNESVFTNDNVVSNERVLSATSKTLEEKKKFISSMTKNVNIDDYLTKSDFIEIGFKLIRANLQNLIIYNKKGASVNLELITHESLIDEIYYFIKYKYEKKISSVLPTT